MKKIALILLAAILLTVTAACTFPDEKPANGPYPIKRIEQYK